MALQDPFPHPPKIAGKFQIRVYRDKDMKALLIFAAAYAARHFCDACLKDLDWDYDDEVNLTTLDGHIRIWSEQLKEIMEHKMTKEESEWVLPRPYPNYAAMVINGDWQPEKPPAEKKASATKADVVPLEKRRAKTTGAKPSKDGLVSIGEICAELGIDPRDARAALRKSKIEKPSVGWSWTPAEVDAIKKIIKP